MDIQQLKLLAGHVHKLLKQADRSPPFYNLAPGRGLERWLLTAFAAWSSVIWHVPVPEQGGSHPTNVEPGPGWAVSNTTVP